MTTFQDYTIEISPPKDDTEIFGAWCPELSLSAFGKTENEAFYNLIENIPLFFEVSDEKKRQQCLRSKKSPLKKRKITIPAFA